MTIGINAVAAFKQPRTGVEEYTYQIIKHLTMLKQVKKHRFVLYTDNNFQFNLPENFVVRKLNWSLPMWTQIRLAAEVVINKPDVLFIPVHVLPLAHPKNSIVTIHGLEYEYYPEMYPWQHLRYLRWSTKYALKNARKIIAVSESTKKDLVELYGANPDKIEVIHHGFNVGNPISNISNIRPYILFLGRIETKKNVHGLIKAFNLLKKKYKVPHKLILAGPKGVIPRSDLFDIELLGYVSEQEKWALLKNAEMMVLPSFYEGFGMPILEAQASGCPIITSNISSMPEVAGDGAMLIDPKNIEQIAEIMYKVIKNRELREDLVKKGYQNVKKFSWQRCVEKTLRVLAD